MWAACTNPDCSEKGIAKEVPDQFWPDPNLHCGNCGRTTIAETSPPAQPAEEQTA